MKFSHQHKITIFFPNGLCGWNRKIKLYRMSVMSNFNCISETESFLMQSWSWLRSLFWFLCSFTFILIFCKSYQEIIRFYWFIMLFFNLIVCLILLFLLFLCFLNVRQFFIYAMCFISIVSRSRVFYLRCL